MKICAHCGRKYADETLNYCLDDGSQLVYGPATEHPTLIKGPAGGSGEDDTAELSSSPIKRSSPQGGYFGKKRLLAAAIAVVVVSVVVASRFGIWSGANSSAAEIRSIAVLPLENLSGDPSQEYFSDGMTDSLIANLSQIRSLKVISRTSVMRFKGSRESLPEIARELGVDAIIEGSVIRSGGRVRVSAQLVRASTDAAIWSRNYEREMPDILKLQSDVAQAVASEIKAKLSSNEQRRLSIAKTQSPDASEEFLLGKYYLQKHTDANLETAIAHFTRAIQIEPDYAEAWAGLSSAWFERGIWGNYSHADVESAARNSAQKALELDPDISSAHIAMCSLNMNYDWDWVSVEEHAKRAIELDPSNSAAYDAYAWFLLTFGRFDEVRQVMMTAEQLDPVSSNLQSDFGRMLYRARLFAEAETHLRKAIELDETNLIPYDRLADLMRETARFDEALALLQKAKDKGAGQVADIRKATVYARMGEKAKALEIWNAVPNKHSGDLALLSTEFGDFDAAFQALNRGLDQYDTILPHIRVEPAFDKLHSDPRWAKFLARMNLPPS